MKSSAVLILTHTEQTTGIVSGEKVTVTHPFLPNYKKEYTLKHHVKKSTKQFVLCINDAGDEALLPVEYTNLGKLGFNVDQQGEAPYYAYGDLVELRKIIDSMTAV